MAKVINVPGVGAAKVPDNATDADIVAFVKKVQAAGSVKAAYDQALAERPGAVMSGIYGAGAALTAAGAAAAEGRLDPLANDLYGVSQSLREESRKYVPEIGSYENIGSVGDAFTYAGEVAGQSLPYMVATGLGGLGGALVGGPPGLVAGATAVGLPLFTGENIIAQAEADKVPLRETDAGRAFGYAIPQTALDVASLGIGGKAFKLFNTASQQAKRGIARQIATQLGKSAAAESLTETSQQALQILQADPDRLMEMDDATVSELLNAAVAGGVLGGVLGGGVESYQSIRGQKAQEAEQNLRDTIQREADQGRGIDIRSETNLGVEALQLKKASPNLEIKPIKKVIKDDTGVDQEVSAFTIRDLGDKSKGKVNIGEFANEDAAKEAVAAYQSMIGQTPGISPLPTRERTPPVPKNKITTQITGEEKTPVQPPLPAEAPQAAPGLGKAVSELPKAPDTPISESPETLEIQRSALRKGLRQAVLYQPSDPKPVMVSRQIKRVNLEDGRSIDFNSKLTTKEKVIEAVQSNRLNDLLGLGPFNKDEVMASQMRGNAPLSVVERTPEGTEVKTAVGTTETAPAQIATMEQAKLAPQNVVAIEPTENVVAGRIAPELTADERVAIWKSVAPQAESFRELTPAQQEQYFSRLKVAQDERAAGTKKKLSAAPAGGVSPEPVPAVAVLASRPELADKVGEAAKKRLAAMGLGKVALKVQTAVKSGEFGRYGQGAYDPATKSIEISLSAVDPKASDEEFVARLSEIVDHEAIHAVVDLGVLTKEEFASLLQTAGTTKYPGSSFTYLERAFATYGSMLKNPDGTVDRLAVSEEAVAEMFRDWNAGRLQVQDKPRGLFTRIREFFRRLRGAANEAGFAKVFEEIKSGEIAGREPVYGENVDTKTEPGADLGVKKFSIQPEYKPQKTIKAYKLFRIRKDRPGELFPLFVDADTPVTAGEWIKAIAGELAKGGKKVASKIGGLAYRPGWHSGDSPMASHIGGKRVKGKPTVRPPDQVWAEVEVPADFDWQSVANSRASIVKGGPNKGKLNVKEAHITDQIPFDGFYRYKTNSNMTGNWIISGQMKVLRVLSDEEVAAINQELGTQDLPRTEPRIDAGVNYSQTEPSAKTSRKLAISPSYTRDNPNYTPEVSDNGNRIRTIVGDPNAQQIKSAFERMDNAAEMFPDPLASEAAWLDAISYAYNEDTGIVMPPAWAIQMAANPQRWASWMKLTPEQISGTDEGFTSIKKIGALYRSGKASPDVTGALFFWVYMSRMASAFPHESGFLDAIEGAMPFIRKAQAGTFTADPALVTMTSTSKAAKDAKENAGFDKDSKPSEIAQAGRSDLDDYFLMIERVLPGDSPGQSVTNNMNSFGRDFLVTMSRPAKGAKISRLAALHKALSDPKKTGPEIRRYFHELLEGDGAGFDNKILSFAILMSGREDVLVFDRIQINQQFGGGQTNKIYDDMASGFNGVRGLVIYEAVERGLKDRIPPLYDMIGRPQDGTLGRYHWESWIRSSGQVVGHPTIEALADLAAGKSDPFIDIASREGRFHRTMYGVQYIRRKGGAKEFVYTLQNGDEYAFTNKNDIDEILNTDNLKKDDVRAVPKWFPGVSSFEGGSVSWRDYPGVNISKIEDLIKAKGRLISAKSNQATSGASGANAARLAGHYATALATRWEFGRKPRGGRPNARIPESYAEADRADAGRDVIAKYVAKPGVPESYAAAGASSPTYLELDPKASAKKFRDAISKSKADGAFGAAVNVYDESEYADMRLFLTEDGTAGFALKGDDIVSVFNTKGGKNKATALAALSLAVQLGGRKLDCFDTVLPGLYAMAGFRAVSRVKFNPEFAPAGWNYDTFGAFNGGMPDVVFMVFDPSSWSVYKSTDGDLYLGDDAYDQAVAAQGLAVYVQPEEAPKKSKKLSVAPAYNNVKQFTQADTDKVIDGLTYGAATDSLQRLLEGFAGNAAVRKFLPERFMPGKRASAEFMRKFVDKMLPLGELIDHIRKNGGTVADAMDTYMMEDLMHSTVAEDLRERETGLYKKVFDFIKANNLKLKATEQEAARGQYGLEDYLYARHAGERNKRIREIGNKDPEKGSGMTDAEAKEILDAVNRMPQASKIKEAAKLFDDIIADTNKIRMESGLTPDFKSMEVEDENGNKVTVDMTVYDHYAPLRGFEEESADSGLTTEEEMRVRRGTGLNVRGREDKRAMGRKSRASDIIAHAITQNTEAVIRGGKNRVGNSLIKLVETNPQQAEEFGIKILKKAPTKAIINKNGVIQTMVDMQYQNRPDILIVKAMPDAAKGLKGGEQVIFEVSNEALQKAIVAKKVAGPAMAEKLLTMAQGVNRWIALVNTGINPEFMLTNFPRDLQTALINIEQYKSPGIRKKIMKDVMPAMRGAWNVIRNPDAKGKWEDVFREFKQNGGMTAGISGINGVQERIQEIGKLMKEPTGSYAERAKLAGGKAIDMLLDMNSAVENAIRVSVYKNLADNGFTQQRAAQAAKNLTVNFDKRGEYGPTLNALYLFFNASVQGSFAIAMAAARSPRVRKILGGIVVLGLMQDIINSLLSPEDEDGKSVYDKIPDYKLRSNIIIMDPFGITGERGYLSIPMPYGYNAVFNLGRTLGRKLRGEYSTLEATNNIVGTFVDAFNPIGGTENLLNAVSPTVVDPFVSLYLNENFAGRKIYPEAFPGAVPKADSNTFWTTTSPAFKSLAQFLNSATGGSEYVPGAVDISPDVMEYWYDYFLGGAGAFVRRTWDTATSTIPSALRGDLEEVEINNIPILRKVVGNVSDRVITEGYMANANYLLARGKELDAAIKSGDAERIKETREKYKEELRVYPRVKSLVNRRNKIASDLRKVRENPRIPQEQKRVRIQQMQRQIVDITVEVNKIYEKVNAGRFPDIF